MPNLLFSKPNYSLGVQQMTEFQGAAVTPADGTDLLNGPCSAVSVVGGGTVALQLVGATGTNTITFPANTVIRMNVSRILATSTTATGIVALYPAGNM